MKRVMFAALTAAVSVFSVAAQANPNLVVNGSFEQGPAGLGSFNGWTTVLGDDGTFVDSDGQTGTHYGQATSGLWSAFFGSTQADGGASISQSIQTVTGQTYVVSFDLANDNGGGAASDAFSASINGISEFSVTNLPAEDYVHRTFTFVGTGPTTLIAFQGFNDNGYAELDNVVATALPEPATWSLFAGGLVALVGGRRRLAKKGR